MYGWLNSNTTEIYGSFDVQSRFRSSNRRAQETHNETADQITRRYGVGQWAHLTLVGLTSYLLFFNRCAPRLQMYSTERRSCFERPNGAALTRGTTTTYQSAIRSVLVPLPGTREAFFSQAGTLSCSVQRP